MQIKVLKPSILTYSQYKHLIHLTLIDGYLREYLKLFWKSKQLKDPIIKKVDKLSRIIILTDQIKYLGWCWVGQFKILDEKQPENEFNVYVSTKYRRKGYGTILFNKAKQIKFNTTQIKVSPHDYCSENFYYSLGMTKKDAANGYYFCRNHVKK